ncbi:hypothetical protein PFISCL1PPCAC_11256, partial [Pristionchus fissidentatus]
SFAGRFMEVIQLDDDDDDFIHSVNPMAARKSTSQASKPNGAKDTGKVAKRPPPISTKIDSDPILKASSSSSELTMTDDECPICGRDLRLLNAQRRTLHLNSCLDDGEAKTDFGKKMDAYQSTMDCPICKTPLAAGPFRSAHLKKCGREHAISGKNLLNLVTTQEKVTENRRKRALPHTSAKTPKLRPKKAAKLDGEPKSVAEEEMLMAKALSASMMEENEEEKREEEEEEVRRKKEKEKTTKLSDGVSPQFTRIINENIRKRRSYAVVELAPRSCKCGVFELVQSRFLRLFRARTSVLKSVQKRKEGGEERRSKDYGNEEDTVKEPLAEQESRTIRRAELTRLDALSWSYRKLAADGEQRGDATIDCSDGKIRAFSWTLLARTTALGKVAGVDPRISIDQPTTVVRHWLHYVYCARVEWGAGEENEGVREIARLHGPEGLVEECERMEKTRREYRGFGRIGSITEKEPSITVATVPPEENESKNEKEQTTVATVPPQEAIEVVTVQKSMEPSVHQEEPALPSDDAIEEDEKKADDEEEKEDGTMDSEGSMSNALKCAAARPDAAQSSQEARASFLAALQAPAVIEIVEITVTTPTSTTRRPPPEEKDSFLESIAGGVTPAENKKDTVAPPPPDTVVESALIDGSTEGPLVSTSMHEGEAMRDILDVSVLRRSPKIRVEKGSESEKRGEEEMEQRGMEVRVVMQEVLEKYKAEKELRGRPSVDPPPNR